MPPSEKEATRSIVREILGEIDLVALQRCQQEVNELKEQNRRLEQNFKLYHELAERRGEQSEQLKNEVAELKNQVALLTSAVENLNHGEH